MHYVKKIWIKIIECHWQRLQMIFHNRFVNCESKSTWFIQLFYLNNWFDSIKSKPNSTKFPINIECYLNEPWILAWKFSSILIYSKKFLNQSAVNLIIENSNGHRQNWYIYQSKSFINHSIRLIRLPIKCIHKLWQFIGFDFTFCVFFKFKYEDTPIQR